ncbi:MAG: VOC family protein [Solirubrobacteraceae bacterium]
MTLRLEHLLIPARDQDRSARFLADLLGLEVSGESSGSAAAHFAVVRVEDITVDFATIEQFDPHHLAFAVDDQTFDAILERIRAAGLQYSADPRHRHPDQLNNNNGGRGLYVQDPDGHNLEFLTRPITARPTGRQAVDPAAPTTLWSRCGATGMTPVDASG